MPVIILGMHRSGTSLITRLLNQCGLYLGEPEDLMLPDPEDNPEGYWENQSISNLNDEILGHFGGSWRDPPTLKSGWSNDHALQPLWHRFDHITANFSSHRSWGWKDPRNSLTLEFWLMHIPDLKVLLCLRNPIEVADSLSTDRPMRDMDRSTALHLWVTYHRAILQQNIADQLTVTHYESYLYDPEAELRRVLSALDIEVSEDQIKNALGTINPASKHHHTPDFIVWDEPELADVRQYYEPLCLLAGNVFEKLRSYSNYVLRSTFSDKKTLQKLVPGLTEQFNQHNRKLAEYDERMNQQQRSLTAHKGLIDRQRQSLIELDARYAVAKKKLSVLDSLGVIALEGYMYRGLQRSKIIAAARKLRNFWSIRRVTRAIHTGQLKIPVLFDEQWYLEQHPDVQEAKMHPYVHFWLFGWYQGYAPMPFFDIHWYVKSYPDFNDDGSNPLEHYESTGQYNGCRPSALFDPQWYLSYYNDVRNAGMDPLAHYYASGLSEGRRPSAESEVS